jgi:hypothetical protein
MSVPTGPPQTFCGQFFGHLHRHPHRAPAGTRAGGGFFATAGCRDRPPPPRFQGRLSSCAARGGAGCQPAGGGGEPRRARPFRPGVAPLGVAADARPLPVLPARCLCAPAHPADAAGPARGAPLGRGEDQGIRAGPPRALPRAPGAHFSRARARALGATLHSASPAARRHGVALPPATASVGYGDRALHGVGSRLPHPAPVHALRPPPRDARVRDLPLPRVEERDLALRGAAPDLPPRCLPPALAHPTGTPLRPRAAHPGGVRPRVAASRAGDENPRVERVVQKVGRGDRASARPAAALLHTPRVTSAPGGNPALLTGPVRT